MISDYLPIRRLSLLRFRSLEQAVIDFHNPLFLVGRNGAGKSNVLKALQFISDCMSQPLESVIAGQGGMESVRFRQDGKDRPDNLGLRVDFQWVDGERVEGWYAMELRARKTLGHEVVRETCQLQQGHGPVFFDRRGMKFSTNLPGLLPAVDARGLLLPLLAGMPQLAPVADLLKSIRVYSIRPEEVRLPQKAGAGQLLRSDGRNLAEMLRHLSANEGGLERLLELLRTVLPDVSQVSARRVGDRFKLELRQQWPPEQGETATPRVVRLPASSMSDGTLRALGILVAFLQKQRPAVVALEEPELTLHPGALHSVLDLMRSFTTDTQVVATTHSPDLLDIKWLEPENLRLVLSEGGKTQVLELGEAARSVMRDHIMSAGELLRSYALRPAPRPVAVHESQPQPFDLFTELRP